LGEVSDGHNGGLNMFVYIRENGVVNNDLAEEESEVKRRKR
jgi:hypothetical protein